MLATALARYRALSRNARLYLISNTIQSVSVGAAVILYTLFLNALHYSNTFISAVIFVGALGGALGILPAGLLVDRLGWRAMLLWSDFLGGGALFLQFILPTPLVTLVTAVVTGLSVAMVIVVNAPLLAANSSQTERTALFGLSNALGLLASVVGSLLGGFLPQWLAQASVAHSGVLLLARPFLVPDATARSYQLALLITGTLAIPSVIPIFQMQENRTPRPPSLSLGTPMVTSAIITSLGALRLWRASVGRMWVGRRERIGALVAWGRRELRGPVLLFTLSQAPVALGAGIFAPYVNIYFVRELHASTAFFGALTSALTITLAVASLMAAPLAERFGRLRLPLLAETVSLPFMVLLGASPVLALAAGAYLVRGFLMNVGSPALSAFYMETVRENQRGVASSVYNGVWQGIWALGAVIGGPISDAGGNRLLFFLAAPLYTVSIFLLGIWFVRPAHSRAVAQEAAEASQERVSSGQSG
jgi:MFS family permease